MVIGLMLAGILTGLVSAAVALVAGQSFLVALGAYALGGIAASVATMMLLLARTAFTSEGPLECSDAVSPPGIGRT